MKNHPPRRRPGLALPLRAGLAAALVAAPAVGAGSTELPPEAVVRALALAREAALALAPAGARVLATPGALDARLRLAPCERVDPYLPAAQKPWGRTRVGLRCTAGANWNVFLPVQLQVLAPAVVARAALPAGAELLGSQLDQAEVDWAAAPARPVTDPASVAGRTLARPLAAGQALRASDLQPRRWFASGAVVQLRASGPGYAISTEALALSAGLEGQVVRVRTDNGRILTGRAVGESRVEVAL